MITWQDYEKAADKVKWIGQAIGQYRRSDEYKQVLIEDEYEQGLDTTIRETVKMIYQVTGVAVPDFTAANNHISSNIFHRLNTQRAAYLLGNGVSFAGKKQQLQADGTTATVDATKNMLGPRFDRVLYNALYWALCNGESYLYMHRGHTADGWEYHLFRKKDFLALKDENTGDLRGGIRFWSLDWRKRPIVAELYTEEGVTVYRTEPGKYGLSALQESEPLRPYLETVQISAADGEEVIGASNYPHLPIFPLQVNETGSSDLVFLRPIIDAIDMILSGFADDLHDCSEMYWTVSNAMGMSDGALTKLRDRMRMLHFVAVDSDQAITPVSQEVPHQARQAALDTLQSKLYTEFGALDLGLIQASATNDHIAAAYKPMDEEADNLEFYLIPFVQDILRTMLDIEDTPIFERSRITNEKERVEMISMVAEHLDERTLLGKLPFLTVDEVENVLLAKESEDTARFADQNKQHEDELDEPEE